MATQIILAATGSPGWGGFLRHAGGSSVETTDQHPPGGWAKGRSRCLCR